MNVRDPATWPQHLDLSYRRLSHAHPTAHAFDRGIMSLCNQVTVLPGSGVIPTDGYTRLCSNCIGALKSWGYLSRSEVVEET